MYKKILSSILTIAIIFSNLQMGTLTISAAETDVIEQQTENSSTQEQESLSEKIEIPSEDTLEIENPKVEIAEEQVEGETEEKETEENDVLEAEEEEVEEQDGRPEESLDELAGKYQDELPDGTYYIRTILTEKKVLDVAKGSMSNKANAVIKTFEKSASQRWKVTHDKKGYITFTNEKSGKVLDVSNGGKNPDKTVWQYASNGTLAQKWIAKKDGNNYEIISAVNGMVLDVKNANSSDNTGMQIHMSNNKKAQKFQVISSEPNVESSGEIIPEGTYRLLPKNNSGYAVEIQNSSVANKANVQIASLKNDELSQTFDIEYKDGYYVFINKYSGKALDVELGGFMPTTNVWQYTYNSTKAQKWAPIQQKDGTYSFMSVHNGMVLTVSGRNVEVQNLENKEEQSFVLQKLETNILDQLAQENKEVLSDGTYYIRSALKNTSVLQIKQASTQNEAAVVINQFNKDISQKWKVVHDELGYVTFINEKSGKVLEVSNEGRNTEKTVWQYDSNNSLAQKWIVQKEGNYYKIISALNGMVLDVKEGKSANNTGLQIFTSNNTPAQRFQIISADPIIEKCEESIPSGYYYICAKANENFVFDIKGGSENNGANVQLYKNNNTFAQAFDIQYDNGYYTVRNMYSNKMLDVASGGFMPTTNVWQYNENGTKAQKWSVKDNGDGSYSFISAHNGMVLDIANGKVASGSNIWVYTANDSDAQKFVLKKAEDFYEGNYNICSLLKESSVMEISGGNIANKTKIQLYNNNKTESQKWVAIRNSDGTFRFSNAKSGKVLDIANGEMRQNNSVWAYPYNGTDAQKWKIEKLKDNSWRIVSVKNPDYVLSLLKKSTSNKTPIVIQKYNNQKEQKWTFKKVNLANCLVKVEISEGKEYVLDKGNTHVLKGREIYTQGTGNSLIWKSSNNDVVSVSSTGQIKGIRHGNAVITAVSKSDKNVSAKIRIYVKESKGQLTKAKLDSMNLEKVKKLMIVAHPDDETFWGGGHLLQDDWLVVCITNARNKKRSKEFFHAMQYSGDKAIILDYADINDENTRDNWKYGEKAIRTDISLLVKYKKWNQITVHNPEGEYGHIHHIMLCKYTSEICKEKGLLNKLYYFGRFYKKIPESLKSNLSKSILEKKRKMVNMYPSQVKDYNKYWKNMEAHEYWIKASNW